MKKYKTLDGYPVFQIHKNNKTYFLADRENYQKEMDKLFSVLDDVKFDSVILLFGLDTGCYLEELRNRLCEKNIVIIIEPDQEIYKYHKEKMKDGIQLFFYQEDLIKQLLQQTIHVRNFNNIYFHVFGKYQNVYQEEFLKVKEQLDLRIVNASTQIGLASRFKEVFLQNMLVNFRIIPKSTPVNSYLFKNMNVPAVILSSGPSFDQNLEILKNNREKLESFFLITGSRNVSALVKNDIYPDLIVSIDPVDANYEMIKDCLDLEVPLAFYENSNRYLLRDYKGHKIYIAALLPSIREDFKQYHGLFFGGSVAHTCIDFAVMLGCSPILLCGQDFAYTDHLHHAKAATHSYDKDLAYRSQIIVKDVNGKLIGTTVTLDYFRRRLEEYILEYQKVERVKFINCSYGAAIKGAEFISLSSILEQENQYPKKNPLLPASANILLEAEKEINVILSYLDEYITKAEQGIEMCSVMKQDQVTKSLMEVPDDDIDLQRFLYILQIVKNFEESRLTKYLQGYFTKFCYDIKSQSFTMLAKDFSKYTSDKTYQANAFYSYFVEMKEMLKTVKEIVVKTVNEFYI